ncbi:MAG TPA: DDE-type integrase/transposase/recombinase, partial [Candidatus Dojkabacteria bacterium]|nr:DDE-type integrase/transposase/recombinase [Candidatus Dojkabacteria bacterium]
KWNHWQKEAFAAIRGIKRFDHYLKPRKFTLITDNESIMTLLKPAKAINSNMIDRWGVFLQQYDFVIKHRPGKELYFEDGLSRSTNFFGINIEAINVSQKENQLITCLLKLARDNKSKLDKENYDEEIIKEAKKLNNKMNFIEDNGILYLLSEDKDDTLRKRIVIPDSLHQEIFNHYHSNPNAGHLGAEKVYDKMKKHVWFPDMHAKIIKMKSNCEICIQTRQFRERNDNLHPIVTTKPFEIIEMDHCGPFPTTTTGYKYVLTIVDHFSRKRWFIPTISTSAEEVITALFRYIIGPFEIPQTILTDQGSAFTSKLAKEIYNYTGINCTFAQPNQHDTMGSVERSNRIMQEIIKKYVNKNNQEDWDIFLPFAAYAINKAKSSSHNFTPDSLVFGRDTPNPFILKEEEESLNINEYKEELTTKIIKAQELANKYLEAYREKMIRNNKDKKEIPKFVVGSKVYLEKTPEARIRGLAKKLDNNTLGPFVIIKMDEQKGNATLQIAPTCTKVAKLKSLFLADQNINVEYLFRYQENKPRILPSKLNEIILIQEIKEFPNDIRKEKEYYPDEKSYNIKNIVGKRVSIYWSAGRMKGWHKGLVIGYTADLTNSLVYYDQRTDNTDKSIDYYSHNLFTGKTRWKIVEKI